MPESGFDWGYLLAYVAGQIVTVAVVFVGASIARMDRLAEGEEEALEGGGEEGHGSAGVVSIDQPDSGLSWRN